MATAKENAADSEDAAGNAGGEVQTLDVEILRDFWDENEERHPAGTVVTLPLEPALDGIESGALRRVKKAAK